MGLRAFGQRDGAPEWCLPHGSSPTARPHIDRNVHPHASRMEGARFGASRPLVTRTCSVTGRTSGILMAHASEVQLERLRGPGVGQEQCSVQFDRLEVQPCRKAVASSLAVGPDLLRQPGIPAGIPSRVGCSELPILPGRDPADSSSASEKTCGLRRVCYVSCTGASRRPQCGAWSAVAEADALN